MAIVPVGFWLGTSVSLDCTNLLSGATVRLYQSNSIPNILNVLADFTECNFAGYARQNLVLAGGPVFNAGLQAYVMSFNAVTFVASGAATPQNVYGILVVDSANHLMWAERDPAAPFSMQANGSYTYVPTFSRKAA